MIEGQLLGKDLVLDIIITPVVFMEGFHLSHSQVFLREDGNFQHKVSSKLYRNCKLNF